MWNQTKPRILGLLCAVALLAACGGGGSGGEGAGAAPPEAAADAITIAPATIEASFLEQGQDISGPDAGPGVEVTATLPAEPPGGRLFIFIEQGEAVVARVTLLDGSARKSRWSLDFNSDLPPADYTGTLRVKVCGDIACNGQPVWWASIPYRVTVKPGIRMTVYVNDRVAAERPVKARDGDRLVMQANGAVRWFLESRSGAHPDEVEETRSSWRAVARYSLSTPGGAGQFTMSAESAALEALAGIVFEVKDR